VASHIGSRESVLPALLERHSMLPVRHAVQGEPIVAGQVLLAPPDLHLMVSREGERAYTLLSRGPRENHARPAIDPLFRTAAAAYGADAIGVVLSGYLDDGTVGLQAIKACGGVAVVQDPADAVAPDMPASAVLHAAVDFVLAAAEIAPALVALAARAPQGDPAAGPPGWVAVENRMQKEDVGMEEMESIGTQVPLTCPECGGAIWEVKQDGPLRYRCHTGHAFTAAVLESLQRGEVEEALWAAVRALHEQEQLYRRLHMKAPGSTTIPDSDYLPRAERTREHGELLRELIATRMRIGPA
jgi:two-component system chemotaxis response regulator CheB